MRYAMRGGKGRPSRRSAAAEQPDFGTSPRLKSKTATKRDARLAAGHGALKLLRMSDKPTTLDEYLGSLSDEQRATIEKMRATIIAVAPRAEAVFSYNMPGFTLDGEPLAWVAAWKRHYSMYPLTKTMADAHGGALADYEMSKGTVKFPADEPVPYALIRKLVKTRAAELRTKTRVSS
jgi:uncharacterized protein YdhG (YjbR/CyaY superfamily)